MTFGAFLILFAISGVDENIGVMAGLESWLGLGGSLGFVFGRGNWLLFVLLAFPSFGKSGRRRDAFRANPEACGITEKCEELLRTGISEKLGNRKHAKV